MEKFAYVARPARRVISIERRVMNLRSAVRDVKARG
jgi:hypothetical protein